MLSDANYYYQLATLEQALLVLKTVEFHDQKDMPKDPLLNWENRLGLYLWGRRRQMSGILLPRLQRWLQVTPSGIPRNGVMMNIERQVDLAKEIFFWLENIESQILKNRLDRKLLTKYWK